MLTITEDIGKINYLELIHYLLKKSDVFTFCLPNFGKYVETLDGERIVEYLDDGTLFSEYKNKVMPKIEKIRTHQLKMYFSENYANNSYDREREIYIVKIDDCLNNSFFENDGLFAWKYPHFPEDICFYKDGKCFMESVSHEKLCFFYLVDDELLRFLEDREIEYLIEDCDNIPRLEI